MKYNNLLYNEEILLEIVKYNFINNKKSVST